MVEKLGNNGNNVTLEYAKLQSFFSAIQTIGSLIVGSMLDHFGFKGGFAITFLASAASYYLLSISSTMQVLYISKIPSLLQAGFLCAQLGICLNFFRIRRYYNC